jgi:hypothetical protein
LVCRVAEDHAEQKVLDDISNFGWHCMHVSGEQGRASFSYTVGLFHSYGHPELIIFGLAPKVAHQILVIAADAAKSGSPLDLDSATDALVNDYVCCFAEVPSSNYYEHVGFARWYYEGNNFPLYQVVWPSRSGLFPWHPQATSEFKSAQPVIAFFQGCT